MEDKVILYHGSPIDFDMVALSASKDKRDFGRGFYMTAVRQQAESWASDLCIRFGVHTAYLYEFSLSLENLKIKTFEHISEEWLEFIYKNRVMGGIQHDFDAVKGPVANDRIYSTLARYLDGTYSTEEALKRLAFAHPNDQVSVHTEHALSNLILIRKHTWKA